VAISIEIRERQKHHLGVLLDIKKSNKGVEISGLQDRIKDALVVMDQEDVAWVEKITGIKAV